MAKNRKTSQRKISTDLPAIVAPVATTDTIAKPSAYIMRKASTVAAMRYPLGNESPADLLYLAFIAKHSRNHALDCVALREAFPNGCGDAYGAQSVAVNAGRIIRLVKLGYCTITAGTDKAPLALAFTELAQSSAVYSRNVA